MTDTITYRELHNMDELNRVVELEQAVWDMTPSDTVPAALLISITGNGGVVIGAETSSGQLVGFTFGVPARQDGEWYLWSYSAGVAPGWQDHGIGGGLKAAQRQWALSHDYQVIRWTFDPMRRANANFNFRRLGVIAERYHINRYGTMTDGLNAGMQSDRLEVTWKLSDSRVEALLSGQQSPQPAITPDADQILLAFEQGQLTVGSPQGQPSRLYIEIPPDLAALKQHRLELAQAWQLAMRDAFLKAFAAGYHARTMITAAGRYWYELVLNG